ncbi:MAG: fibronectin type III domain-containing protein, partial [Deltaproteobacteria bacterium]|nr:fibronectin type III domain-containing protein [Deltaproteobacteria bacterium]
MKRDDVLCSMSGRREWATARVLVVGLAVLLLLAPSCGGDGAGDAPERTSSVQAAVMTEPCGNGIVDLYRAPPPACPNPAVVTEVFDRADLDAWLTDPTTTLDVKASIAFSAEPLEIATACDVFVRSGVVLSGLTDVFVAARRVDVYADVVASGRVDLRAAESIYLRTASSVTGPAAAIAMEAPYVDDHADTVGGMYCIEGGQVFVRQASKNGSSGGAVRVSGTSVDVHGDFTTPGTVRMTSTGDLIYRQAARIETAASVTMTSGGLLDFHGTLYDAGPVELRAGSFFYRDAAFIETSGNVGVAVSGTTLTDFYGTMRSNGDVNLSAASLYLRQAALIKSDRDVTLAVAGRYDMRGKIQQNEDVRVTTGTYKLYGTHSFSGNTSCVVAGARTSDSVAAVGCVESTDAAAPGWPAGSALVASDIGPHSLTLSWTPAADAVGVVAYRVYQDGLVIGESDAGTRTWGVTGLASGTIYVFKVEAGDAAGRWSTDGPSTTATTESADA